MSKPLLEFLSEALSMLSAVRHRDSKLPDINEILNAAATSHRALEIATAKAVQADKRETQGLAEIEVEIADLEERAVLALRGNEQALAAKASAVLVDLEHRRTLQAGIAREARATLHHLEAMLAADKLRLRKIQHGRTVAELRALTADGFEGSVASVLLIQACITLTKTLRDDHESKRLINRLDNAKTEKLLSDVASR